jgi:hypothetical protein
MRPLMRLTAGGLLALVALSGCATLQENRPACLAVATLAGAIPAAVGGAVGVHNINRDNNPDVPNGHVAAGAAAGAVAGGLVGLLIGYHFCPEEEVAPPPPPPPPPPPLPPPTQRRGG